MKYSVVSFIHMEVFDSDKVEKPVYSLMGFVDALCSARMLLMAGLFATVC